jgi:hypothetical protein
MKQILIQPRGNIVAHWHFAHVGCDCYGFINHISHELQWEPTNSSVSGVGASNAKDCATLLKENWPDHLISSVIIE